MTCYMAQGILLNIMQQPKWEKNLKRIDTCICITESLCCTLETNTILLYLINYMKVKESVAQSYKTLFGMDCSSPGSSVSGILQARILEWAAISFSRGSSQPRDQTCVYCLGWSDSLPLAPSFCHVSSLFPDMSRVFQWCHSCSFHVELHFLSSFTSRYLKPVCQSSA